MFQYSDGKSPIQFVYGILVISVIKNIWIPNSKALVFRCIRYRISNVLQDLIEKYNNTHTGIIKHLHKCPTSGEGIGGIILIKVGGKVQGKSDVWFDRKNLFCDGQSLAE